MRFTTAAVVLASGAMASPASVSTAFTTQLVTVTDCPPEVVDCPAHQKTTAVQTTVLPLTTSTVYSTRVHTITSCAPEVVDCPAHSTVYSTETVAAYTTVCPVTPTQTPQPWNNNTVIVVPSGSKPVPVVTETEKLPQGPGSTKPAPQGPATTEACKGDTVTAITKSYTTVLTTVEYSTIKGSCPGATGVPTGAVPPPAKSSPAGCNGKDCPPPAKPTGGAGCTGANCTTPVVPPVTAGAASFAGSALFAAAAGVAAYVFA